MNRIFEVIVPRMGVNDEVVTIVDWLVNPGGAVKRGDAVATVETTKASFDVDAEEEGYFFPLAEAGHPVSIRDVIGLILDTNAPEAVLRYREDKAIKGPAPQPAPGDRKLTARARLLVDQYGIDLSLLPADRIVREQDVLRFVPVPVTRELPQQVSNLLVIYGASQGGLAVLECVRSADEYEAAAFLDDSPGLAGTDYHGLPVWAGSQLEQLAARGIGGVATHIADARVRLALRDRALACGLIPFNVIHGRAHVAATAKLGLGNLVKAGAVVDAHTELGDCCIIDNGVILPHHNRIGNGCHLAPGACFGGDCEVGDNTVIGIGAVVSARTRIGKNVIVGVGAVVTRDVPDNSIVEGTPARIAGRRK